VRTRRLDLAHVRDVEHADGRAHREMLLANPGVLDRHLPAGERHEPRSGGDVTVMQGRALQRLSLGGDHPRKAIGWFSNLIWEGITGVCFEEAPSLLPSEGSRALLQNRPGWVPSKYVNRPT